MEGDQPAPSTAFAPKPPANPLYVLLRMLGWLLLATATAFLLGFIIGVVEAVSKSSVTVPHLVTTLSSISVTQVVIFWGALRRAKITSRSGHIVDGLGFYRPARWRLVICLATLIVMLINLPIIVAIQEDFHSGTTWGRRGRTPVVSSTGARFGANLISAISAQGQLRFMLTKGRVTAAVFTEFLKRLLINASAPIFVIVDGHPTHRAKSVARFVAAQADKLALFFLPPYSPELNPDELVWNDLKSHGTGRKLIISLPQLRQMVVSHMRQLQKLPALVRSFFHAPTTRYARA